MRKFLMLLATAGLALPAFALQSVSVAELEQKLAASRGKLDADVADLLSDVQLTQRLSLPALARLDALAPGEKTKERLAVLADQSSFLELPPAEIPSAGAPDFAAQRNIMSLAVNYVAKSTHQMPNFIATRATRSYIDRPKGLLSPLPLHLVGQSAEPVVYRDGREVAGKKSGRKVRSSSKGQVSGLVSYGEFGPILTTVLLDAAKNQLAWSHWEEGFTGPLAVFRYAVPAKHSHYQVQFAESDRLGEDYREFSSYHGELAIDPVSGAILRLTAIADLAPDEPVVTASIMVQYGPVAIGEKSYICPVRSVALAQKPDLNGTAGAITARAVKQLPLITLLNEVDFEEYHVFRGEPRILTGEEARRAEAADEGAPPTLTDHPTAAPEAVAPAEASKGADAGQARKQPEPTSNTASASQEAAEPTISSTTAHTAEEARTEPPSPPAEPAAAPKTSEPQPLPDSSPDIPQTPLFKTSAREVVVDVVVTKKDGDQVTGLTQQDFTVAEEGQAQSINFFEEHQPDEKASSSSPAMPPLPAGTATNAPAASAGDAVNVLLLDTLNTERVDQAYVRARIDEFFKSVKPGTQMAIFVLGSRLRFVQGFTSDPSTLRAALNRKDVTSVQRQPMAHTQSDDADEAEAIATLRSMSGPFGSSAGIDVLQNALQDMKNYSSGTRASMTFEAMNQLAHYLQGIPGRKNLLWFAGSFPVVLFPTPAQQAALEKDPKLPGYVNQVKKTADLFTQAKIAVYPIAAQGMMTSHIGEADSAGPGIPLGAGHGGQASGDAAMTPYTAEAGGRAAWHRRRSARSVRRLPSNTSASIRRRIRGSWRGPCVRWRRRTIRPRSS